MLEAQWQTIVAELKELQWIKKGLRQEHEKNMADLKTLKNTFSAKF